MCIRDRRGNGSDIFQLERLELHPWCRLPLGREVAPAVPGVPAELQCPAHGPQGCAEEAVQAQGVRRLRPGPLLSQTCPVTVQPVTSGLRVF
eukprot:4584416-Alexandrium_andersonii.AAC.1